MYVQKRQVKLDSSENYPQEPSTSIEQKNHKCWRRFMNERAIDRAYVPTNHGICELSSTILILIYIYIILIFNS